MEFRLSQFLVERSGERFFGNDLLRCIELFFFAVSIIGSIEILFFHCKVEVILANRFAFFDLPRHFTGREPRRLTR